MKSITIGVVSIFMGFLTTNVLGRGGSGHLSGSHIGTHSSSPSHSGWVVNVKGYVNSHGTYVAPYHRSAPDQTTANNWSTKGNINPYTGKAGTRNMSSAPGGVATSSRSVSSYYTSEPVSSGEQQLCYVPQTLMEAQPASPKLQQSSDPSIVKMNYDKSDPILEFQKQNATKGFPPSRYALGMRYLKGDGVAVDKDKGMELIMASAAKGHLPAKEKIKELRANESARANEKNTIAESKH